MAEARGGRTRSCEVRGDHPGAPAHHARPAGREGASPRRLRQHRARRGGILGGRGECARVLGAPARSGAARRPPPSARSPRRHPRSQARPIRRKGDLHRGIDEAAVGHLVTRLLEALQRRRQRGAGGTKSRPSAPVQAPPRSGLRRWNASNSIGAAAMRPVRARRRRAVRPAHRAHRWCGGRRSRSPRHRDSRMTCRSCRQCGHPWPKPAVARP